MYPHKIKRSEYEKIKKIYLEKNRTLHSIYVEFSSELGLDRYLFYSIINKIRVDEGYAPLNK